VLGEGNVSTKSLVKFELFFLICLGPRLSGQLHNMLLLTVRFPTKFAYLGSTLTVQNCNNEEIKSMEWLLSFDPEYLPSCLLSKDIKIKIYIN
jgi:hypothetical protein